LLSFELVILFAQKEKGVERFEKRYEGGTISKQNVNMRSYNQELKRILKMSNVGINGGKILSIAKTITTLKINLPISGETVNKTMFLNGSHTEIARIFDIIY